MNKTIAVLIASLIFVSPLAATGPGTTAMNFLKIEAGAKASGMGGAFSAVANDASAVWWNPAGLSQQRVKQASFTHLSWFEGVNYQYASYVHPLEKQGALGAGISYLSVGGIDSYDDFGALLDSKLAVSGLAAVLSYANKLYGIEYGANLKYLREDLADESASALATDMGLLYRIRTGYSTGIVGRQMKLALSAQNLGQGVKYIDKSDPLPLNYRLGAAQDFFGETLTIAFDLNLPSDGGVYSCTGADYRITDWISLRGGYRNFSGRADGDARPELTCGLGIGNEYIAVDYAFAPYGDLELTHRIGVNYRFGKAQTQNIAEANIQKHLDRARKFYARQDYINSYREFDNVLTLDPVNLEAKDYIETITREINSVKVDKYIALARKHQDENRLLEAKRLLDDVLKFFPDDPEAQKHLTSVQAAIVEQKNMRAESLFAQGREFFDQGQFADALPLFEKTLVINSAHPKSQEYIALCNAELVKLNEQKKQEQLEQDRAKAAGLLEKGNMLVSQGKPDKARPVLEEALSLDRGSADIQKALASAKAMIADQYYKKGLKLYSSGDLKEAVRQLEEASRLDPGNSKISENLTNIRAQFEESEKSKADILNREGLKEYDSGSIKKAAELWEKALLLDPENTKIKNNLNRAREELNKKP